jgi:tRNA (guanine37-N1)-methyltransferase
MWFGLITLFPEMFSSMKEFGVLGRAVSSGMIEIEAWNPRDFALDKHRTVDDRPYGGGPGMLMKVQPLEDALEQSKLRAKEKINTEHGRAKVIYLSPQGQKLDHELALSLAKEPALICVSGRYEGIDERLIESQVDLEVSIGDYVLSGGELATMVLIDAIARLVPGVLGHEDSAKEDSFATGLLDCPHYTRPEFIDGAAVPEVLMSGNHERIRKWRLQQALGRTYVRRPDLLQGKELSEEQKLLLAEYLKDVDR